MQKNNQGITLISLIVMIIVILILASVYIVAGLNSLKETENSKIRNEINSLQQAVATSFASYLKNEENTVLIGQSPTLKWTSPVECASDVIDMIDFSGLSSEEKDLKKGKITGDIVRDFSKYVKIIGSSEAKMLGVDPFDANNQYIVDYYTTSVYGPIN